MKRLKQVVCSCRSLCLLLCLCGVTTLSAQEELEWGFNTQGNIEGWNNVYGSYTVQEGSLIFRPSNTGAQLTRGVSFDATRYKYLTLRVKNGDMGNTAAVSFRSSTNPASNRYGDLYLFKVSTTDQDFQTYTIDLSKIPYWKGTILALKIQLPINPAIGSTIIVDYIKLHSSTTQPIVPRRSIAVNKVDSIVLTRMYHALEGDRWTRKTHWLSSQPVSRWEGITLNQEDIQGKIAKIALPNSNVSGGDICLDDLTALKTVNFSGNGMRDIAFLSSVKNLDSLHLEGNALSITQLLAMKTKVKAVNGVFTYAPQEPITLEKNNGNIRAVGAGEEADNLYQWFDINGLKVYETRGNSTYTPPTLGTYHVKVSNPRLPGLVLVSAPATGIATGIQVLGSEDIKLYPNPATEYIVVEHAQDAQLFIYQLSGKLQLSTKLKSQSEKISVKHLNPGLYMVVVKQNMGEEIKEMNYKLIIE